jgi:predicted phosphodiesterase
MRVLLTTDLHANLLAAEAAITLSRRLGADEHIHLGDSIDLGPWPRETLEQLLAEGVRLLMGNHEEYATSRGLNADTADSMPQGQQNHYAWTKDQLSSQHLAVLEELPYTYELPLGSESIRLQHFALKAGRIDETLKNLAETDLNAHFTPNRANRVFFGHIHGAFQTEQQGVTYRSLMSSGCAMGSANGKEALLLSEEGGRLHLQSYSLEWSTEDVIKELKLRQVPDWTLVRDIFFQE